MKKIITFILVFVFALVMVGCKDDKESSADPTVPTAIAIKVKVAKVQITKSIDLTYTITPATAQNNDVTVTVNNKLATVAKEDTKTVKLTAGDTEGTVKVTVTTTNGISASKTIKIQKEAVETYPDLNGYAIKIAQAESALGEIDVKLTAETKDQYGYYSGSDREAKLQAWEEIEDNYNCSINVVAYPSDAPWGPSRWAYILDCAQKESPEYDFYITPNAQIPQYVAGSAVVDITDWYSKYGKNCMNDMDYQANSYKNKLYGFICQDVNLPVVMSYNINLLKELQTQDPDLVEPAQLFLDGKWDYEDFEAYCKQVQTAMISKYGADQGYYCLSGYGTYYWQGMVNAAGVKILDVTSMKVNITGTVEQTAAQTMQNIYAYGAMDPAMQVDEGVTSWNNQHALFNVGSFWFVNNVSRWSENLWGEDTAYGYVPFPSLPGQEVAGNYVAVTSDACYVMAAKRDWAYADYGAECTAENVFRAYMDYWTTAKEIYESSESYDRVEALTSFANARFGSQASVQAYLKIILGTKQEDGTYINSLDDYGFYDPFIGSNGVVSSWGGDGSFAKAVVQFIKGADASAQWVDAVGGFESTIVQSLYNAFG